MCFDEVLSPCWRLKFEMAEAPLAAVGLPPRGSAAHSSSLLVRRWAASFTAWFLGLSQAVRLTVGGAALLLLLTILQQVFTLRVSGQNIAFPHIAGVPSVLPHTTSAVHEETERSTSTSGSDADRQSLASQLPVRQQLEQLKLQEQKLLQLLGETGGSAVSSTHPVSRPGFSGSTDISLRKGRCRAHNLTQYRYTAVTTRFKDEETWEIDLWAGALRCLQIPRFDEPMPTLPPDAQPDATPPPLPCPGEPGWVYDEYRVPVRIYDKVLRPAAYTAPIVGREEMGYLSYIVDFYDCLPAYSLFLHPEGGRNRGLHNWLQCLRPDVAAGALTSAGLPWMSLVDLIVVRDMNWASRTLWRLNEASLHFTGKPILPLTEDGAHPDFGVVSAFCCAEFLIPRESIRAYPRAFWEFALNEAVDTFLQGEIAAKAPIAPSRLPPWTSPSGSKTPSASVSATPSRSVTGSATETATATASLSATRSCTSSLSASPSVDETQTSQVGESAGAGAGAEQAVEGDGAASGSGELALSTPPPSNPEAPLQPPQEQPPLSEQAPPPQPPPPAIDPLLEAEEVESRRDFPTGQGTADPGHSVSYHWEFLWGLLFEHTRLQRNYTQEEYCLLFRGNCTGSPCDTMPTLNSGRRLAASHEYEKQSQLQQLYEQLYEQHTRLQSSFAADPLELELPPPMVAQPADSDSDSALAGNQAAQGSAADHQHVDGIVFRTAARTRSLRLLRSEATSSRRDTLS